MALRRLALCASLLALLGWAGGATAIDRIDPRHFDTKANACVDLYQFANGGWLTSTPVPPGLQRNNWLAEQRQTVNLQRQQMLSELSTSSDDALEATVATFLTSVRNEPALAGARQTALGALLPALDQIQKPAHVRELLASYQERGLPLLLFARRAGDQAVEVETDVLTLPDPAFYTSPTMQGEVWRSRLGTYIGELLTASGSADVATETAWALDFEMKVAAAMQAPSAQGLSLRDLDQRTPGIEWKPLFKALKLDGAKVYRFSDFSPYPVIDRLIADAHPVQWKAWLRYRIAHLLAPYLDAPFREPHDRLIRGQLLQQELPISAEQRAEDLAQRLLGPAMARLYAERNSGEAKRAIVTRTWTTLIDALNKAIDSHPDWDEKTRKLAHEKLAALTLKIDPVGDRPDLSKLKLSSENLPGNALAILRWRQQNVERDESTAWLSYQRERNVMHVASEALQPPLFDASAEPAVLYGGLGTLMAHELIHAVDLGGASFDDKGESRPWWSEAERAGFSARIGALDTAQALPEPTLSDTRYERAADLSALRLSMAAFLNAKGSSNERQHGLNPEQRFFVAWATQLRENSLPATPARAWPNQTRVNSPLAWVAGFGKAFQCSKVPAPLSPDFWP